MLLLSPPCSGRKWGLQSWWAWALWERRKRKRKTTKERKMSHHCMCICPLSNPIITNTPTAILTRVPSCKGTQLWPRDIPWACINFTPGLHAYAKMEIVSFSPSDDVYRGGPAPFLTLFCVTVSNLLISHSIKMRYPRMICLLSIKWICLLLQRFLSSWFGLIIDSLCNLSQLYFSAMKSTLEPSWTDLNPTDLKPLRA